MTGLVSFLLAWLIVFLPLLSQAQGVAQPGVSEVTVSGWLNRLHGASRQRAYTGTLVVSAGTHMVSAKIWHVCDGERQLERVESLSGPVRSTFRQDDKVVTFFRDAKVAVVEKRESLGVFPNFMQPDATDVGRYYKLKVQRGERVAGLDTDVAQLEPQDGWRYGYRIWSEKNSGLVLQLQTLGMDGRVLEQVAFSDLQLNAPVSAAVLSQQMAQTEGYRMEYPQLHKTTAATEGWELVQPVPGFKSVGCYRAQPSAKMQWIFSDGLATVSLFAEPFDRRRHISVGLTSMGGAAHSQSRRMDEWWIVAVGEVPPATLNAFAQGLERKK